MNDLHTRTRKRMLTPSSKQKFSIFVVLGKILLLAVAYCMVSILGVLLAIFPLSFLNYIWLSSGVAVVGLLFWGYRYWPGVLLGAFCLSWLHDFDPTHATPFLSFGVAVVLGLGASLQALLGAYLVRRCLVFPNPLEAGKDIFLFMLLAGPVACLVAATLGLITLAITGFLPNVQYWIVWLEWWAGDALGVVLLGPSLLVIFTSPELIPNKRKMIVAGPLATFLLFVIVLSLVVRESEHREAWQNFEQHAGKQVHELQGHLQEVYKVLHSMEAFFEASERVTRQEFHVFTRHILKEGLHAQALGWVPLIRAEERKQYEKKIQEEGFADFQIVELNEKGELVPAGLREQYFPATYVEPWPLNRFVLGFDLGSSPARREALEVAWKRGKEVATIPLTLALKDKPSKGFLIIDPVFQEDKLHQNGFKDDDLQGFELHQNGFKDDDLQGFVVAVFQISDIIQAILQPQQQERIYVADTQGEQEIPLYGKKLSRPFVSTHSFKVAERNWQIHVFPPEDYLVRQTFWPSWLIFFTSSLFHILFSALLLVTTGRTSLVAKMVEEKTHELNEYAQKLKQSNQDLDDFAYIASHDLKEPLRGISNQSRFLLEDYQDKLEERAVKKLHRLIYLSNRLEKLIDDLLYFSRLGREHLSLQETDIEELVKEIRDTLQHSFVNEKLDIRVVTPLPKIVCKQVRVRELFRNLITNAIKYNDKSVKQVKVGFKARVVRDQREIHNVFFVADNGIGIKKEFQHKIFGIFKRLHTNKQYAAGTGVGLTFVKKIVKQHGGEIWVESQPEKGSVFYFTLQGAMRPW